MLTAAVVASVLLGAMGAFAVPRPRGYVCYRTPSPPTLDGRMASPVWDAAPWTEDFVDIEGDAKPKPRYRTRAKMLWDDKDLYIAAELIEPHVWGTLTERDSVIFHDNDFEVFLNPNDDAEMYSELEMNALNTVWDQVLPMPYLAGGGALAGWDIKGLQTAVHVNGSLNDPGKPSESWTVEIAIPWDGIREIGRVPVPPEDGDQWRINFSRVEWDIDIVDGKIVKRHAPEHNWVWSQQGVIDMHRPEMWGVLQFSSKTSGQVDVKPLDGWEDRCRLFAIWNAENAYRRDHGRFTDDWSALGITLPPGVKLQATTHQFEASSGHYWIDTNRKLWRTGIGRAR